MIMGLSSAQHPAEDPHAAASWAEAAADLLLEQAKEAASGGDVPRARSLVESVLRRSSLRPHEEADAWDLALEIAVLCGDAHGADEAVDQLSARLPVGEVRQRIRMAWMSHPADVAWENALLERAESAVRGAGRAADRPADEPGPEPSVLRLLEAIGGAAEDDGPEDAGISGRAPAAPLSVVPPTLPADEPRSPGTGGDVRARLSGAGDVDAGEALPLLPGTETAAVAAGDASRRAADLAGERGPEMLRRHVLEQARRTAPEDLGHSYDLAVELFGQARHEEAAHLLVPVATAEGPERLGALELLARSLFELDRLPHAEAYLREAVPPGRGLRDPAYAPLFYWLGRIGERKGEPGDAIDAYAAAVRHAPELADAKRRLQALLAP